MENNQACMKEVKLAASFKREILKLENCNSVDTKSTLDSEHSNKSVSKIICDKKEEIKTESEKCKQKMNLYQFKKHRSLINEINTCEMKSIYEEPYFLEESPVPSQLMQMKSTNVKCSGYDKIQRDYMFPKRSNKEQSIIKFLEKMKINQVFPSEINHIKSNKKDKNMSPKLLLVKNPLLLKRMQQKRLNSYCGNEIKY